jgi:hypothetical protein
MIRVTFLSARPFHGVAALLTLGAFALASAGCWLRNKDDDRESVGEGGGAGASTVGGGDVGGESAGGAGGGGGSGPESDWIETATGATAMLDAVWSAGDLVVAAGVGGTIVRSDDAGVTWASVASGVTADLYGVWHDGTSVWIVGAAGTVLVSGDGGLSFAESGPGVVEDLTAVWGLGADDVLVSGLGAGLHHSDDDGQSWTLRSSSSFAAIWGLDETQLYAVSDKYVRQSDNAGGSWSTMLGSYANTNHQDIWALSDNYIVTISGWGTVFTYSGSWSYSVPLADRDLHGIWGNGSSDVFVVGDGGGIMRSTSQEACGWVDTDLNLRDVHGSSGRVYIVGESGTSWRCELAR